MIYIITDLHIGVTINGKVDIPWSWQKPALERFLEELREGKPEAVFLLGDILNDPGDLPPAVGEMLKWFGDSLNEVCGDLDIMAHVIPGNHDCVLHLTSVTPNWVWTMWGERYSNLKVYNTPETIKLREHSVRLYPWSPEQDAIRRDLVNREEDIVMAHLEVSGMRYSPNHPIVVKGGIDPLDMSRFQQVFLGHFHLHQRSKNICYVGAPYPLNRGDLGESVIHGYVSYDPKTHKIAQHSLHDECPFVVLDYEDRIYEDSELEKLSGKMVYLNMKDPSPHLRADLKTKLLKVTAGLKEDVQTTAKSSCGDSPEKESDQHPQGMVDDEDIVRELVVGENVDVESIVAKFQQLQ